MAWWEVVVGLVVVGVSIVVSFMLVSAGLVVGVIRCVAAGGAVGRCVGAGPGFWMGKTVVGESEISKSTEVSTARETTEDRK